MRNLLLNFLDFEKQDFGINIYRRKAESGVFKEEFTYYDLDDSGTNVKYEISENPLDGFSAYILPSYRNAGLVSKKIYESILEASNEIAGQFILHGDREYNRRIHFQIESHPKGRKCIWVEPYYLKAKQLWGILIGYQFVINDTLIYNGFKQDRDIQIASGSLNSRGLSNLDFYLFKYNHITTFLKNILPSVNKKLPTKLNSILFSIESSTLGPKQYIFKGNNIDTSSYYGLSNYSPLESVPIDTKFFFIYKKVDRVIAVNLLKGLRGESHPNTFSGIEKFFKIPFANDHIKGLDYDDFDNESITDIIKQIKAESVNVLPIIITNSKKDEDEKLYFTLKHRFTNEGIPCQVVTKDLINNESALKFSLGNIALQMFAKAGGKPWKMKPAINEYLIIGIGQSYNIEHTDDGNKIEKNITYSILTDSSGIFKDLKVLSEGVGTDDSYYDKLVNNIVLIINNSKYRKIAIHTPFRLSKEKVLKRVVKEIDSTIELSVLVINDKTDFFGFDASNNGLVPFESTFVKLSAQEYLVWFEGLQPNNPKITKRFGNPLLIKFWFTNKPELFNDFSYKETLLQDCINLSGANWRGFKAKQLPVSVFYCQRISEFISKFRYYELTHIDINNLKPWFL